MSIVHRIVVGSVIAAIVAGLTPLTASAAAAPAAWRDPVAISQPGLSAEYLVADGNADGSAVAAWIARTDENVRSLEVSRREFGGPWGPPERVADIGDSSARVVVAMHDDGTVALAWNDARTLWTRLRPATTGAWTQAAALSTPGAWAQRPTITARTDGTTAVAWIEAAPPTFRFGEAIVAASARGREQAAWPMRSIVSEPGLIATADLSAGPDGGVVLGWQTLRPGAGLASSDLASDGSWTEPAPLPTPPTLARLLPTSGGGTLAVGGAGEPDEPSARAVVVGERPPGAPWPAFTQLGPGSTRRILTLGDAGLDASGAALATWRRRLTFVPKAPTAAVEVAARPPGGPWAPPRRVSRGQVALGYPRLALAPAGAATVVWSENTQAGGRIVAAQRRGGRWRAPERVTRALRPRLYGASDVLMDGAGRASVLALDDDRVIAVGRNAGDARTIRLDGDQLLINQRISQAAVRRADALAEAISGGLTQADLRPGALTPQEFGAGVVTAGEPDGSRAAPRAPRKLMVPAPERSTGARLRLSAAQLRINQRVSQAAVRRAAALAALLDGRLTGGNLRDGTLGPAALAPGVTIVATADGPAAPPGVPGAAPVGSGGRVTLSAGQLVINQRIAQAAVRRVNALVARFEAGLTGSVLRPGSLSRADLAPELRRP